MSQTIYCYHCRIYHPVEEMRLLVTKTGKRWRCIKSIAATKGGVEQRDAYGRRVTELNKAEAQAKAKALRTVQP